MHKDTCEMSHIFLFFSFSIKSIPLIPDLGPWFALPPAHSLAAPTSPPHTVIPLSNTTPLLNLLHPSIRPSSRTPLLDYPYISVYFLIKIFFLLRPLSSPPSTVSFSPLHPISLSNPYSCNPYIAACSCC